MRSFVQVHQRALIDDIIDDVRLKDAKVKPVPAKVSLKLHAFKDTPPFDLDFNYRSAVGKLNYLAQTTRPDIMYVTHQIAKYSSNPRQSHGEAILYLVCYLKKTHYPSSSLIPRKVLNATATLISQETGTRHSHLWTPVLPSHEAVGSSSTQDAPSPGLLISSCKSLCLLQEPITLLCYNLYVTSSLL